MLAFFMIQTVLGSNCNVYCSDMMKNNQDCDLDCMNKLCDFDNGKCQSDCSATGCTKLLSDNICDNECDNIQCGYDFGDCSYCSNGCTQIEYDSRSADIDCKNALCNYNNKLYECASGCNVDMLHNGVCNSECKNAECNFDSGDCKDESIDEYIIESSCITDFYPSSDCSVNIIDTISRVSSKSFTLQLSGKYFYLSLSSNGQKNALKYSEFTEIIIKPYYCTQGNKVGCLSYDEKPTIILTDELVNFEINGIMKIINITFSHHYKFDTICTTCDYCRYVFSNTTGDFNDRNEAIITSEYLSSDYCEKYKDFSLFKVEGYFELIGVDFEDMRMEYRSIIEIGSATVNFTDVNFYNIVPSSQGSVIKNKDQNGPPNSDVAYFEYNGGKVQLLNNGFEMTKENKVGSFLDLFSTDEIKLNGLEFSYNLLSSSENSLIILMDFYIATITDCKFFYNYSPGNLIYLNQENINLYQDSAAGYVNEEGVYIASSEFYNNTANYLIYGSYKSSCQNILIEDIEVNDNISENILIYINKEGTIDKTCFEGDVGTSINKMHLIIQDSYFSGNTASKIIDISTIANLELNNLEFNGIGYFADTNEVMFDIFTAYQDVYLTETDLMKETSCSRVICLSSIKSLSISNIAMDGNICSILELSSVSGEISISESTFSNIDLKNSQGAITISSYSDLDISNLNFYNISCPACGNGIIIILSPDYSITANLENLIFDSACYALTISSIKTIVLNNIEVFNCIAEIYSGLSLTSMVNSKVYIQNSVFSNNTGICVYIDSSGSSIIIELSIEDSIFEYIKDTSSVIEIANSVILDPISKISNTKFINSLNQLIKLASVGKLTISDCYFGYNYNHEANLISVYGNIEFIIENSIFEYNMAQAILLIEKFSFGTVSKTKNCIFRFNKSTGVNIMQSYYEDEGSQFYNNSFTYCPTICLANLAIGNITGTRITGNIAESKSIIYMSYTSSLYIYNSYIAYNIVGTKGILFVDDSSEFYIENSEFVENTASQGSCIFIQHSFSRSSIYNTNFTNNSAKKTGCICLLESSLSLNSCTFDGNTGTSHPAVEAIYYANITIENSYFSYHIGEGAHISVEGSSVANIKSTVFTNGYSGSSESSIKVYGGDFTCEECIIKNSDFREGNTVNCERSNCTFYQCRISKSYNNIDGAVIKADNMANLIIEGTDISEFTGSAVYIGRNSYAAISSSSFSYGQGKYGSAILCLNCYYFSIDSSEFSHISSEYFGGCIMATPDQSYSITSSISNSNFKNCSSLGGGAIYATYINLKISETSFIDNEAVSNGEYVYEGQGGGIFYLVSDDSYHLEIDECSFEKNSASLSGGGLQWYGNQPIVISSTFTNNSAYYGPDQASYPISIQVDTFRSLTSIAPGQTVSTSIIASARDHYKNIVLTDNISTAQLKSSNTSFEVIGISSKTSSNGIFTFSNFAIYGKPNSSLSLTITGDFALSQSSSCSLEIYLRECIIGEVIVENIKCSVCEKNTYNLDAGAICKSCPTGGVCEGGANIHAAAGYWRKSKTSDKFFACPNANACLEESDDNLDHCLAGYKGNLCQSCDYGYSRSGENECTKCMDENKNIGMLTGILALFIIVLVGLTASSINGAYKEQSITSIYFKILMNYFQIVALTISFNLEWPALVKKLFSVQGKATGASDQLFSVDCYLASSYEPYYAKLIILAFIPLVCGILSILFWVLWAKVRKSSNVKEKIIGSMIVQLFFFQPTLVKFNFATFNCMELAPGEYYMIKDMSIQCWKSSHLTYALTVVVPSIILWCISVPAILVLFLWRNRMKLSEITEKLKYGFLYKGFKEERFYWEFITMMRKMLIISCSVFLSNVSVPVQALATFVVILISYIIHQKFKPYIFNQLNEMELKSITVSAVTIYSGLFFLTGDLNNSTKILLFILMVISNVIFVTYWGYYTFGFYIGKIYIKLNCCKKIFGEKLVNWVNKVVPISDSGNVTVIEHINSDGTFIHTKEINDETFTHAKEKKHGKIDDAYLKSY